MKSKYYGKILDGKWLIKDYRYEKTHYYYTLENVYNDQTIEITHTALLKILKGETSVSKIISFRLHKNKIGYETKRLSNRINK